MRAVGALVRSTGAEWMVRPPRTALPVTRWVRAGCWLLISRARAAVGNTTLTCLT